MRLLVIFPPHVPSYFNAGHHLPTFSVAAYLRVAGHDVDAVDAGALNYTWKDFGDLVFRGGYQAVVIINEYDVVEGVRRAADYCRALAPEALLVTVGRLSYENPEFFRTDYLDAVVASGDHEVGVSSVLAWASEGRPRTHGLPGVHLRFSDEWVDPAGPGVWLPVEEWVLPDVREIPYAAYSDLYRNDADKFCGIPGRLELVVPVARGCPVNCSFCDVPAMQGMAERRMNVERTVAYIRESFELRPFEYVAFYAPTFTLDRRWVERLCEALKSEPCSYPWKCATTLHHLSAPLIASMGEAGCIRISVGVETFEEEAAAGLPRIKRHHRAHLQEVALSCQEAGIELNCFVIVGLPGTTPDGARRTMDVIAQAGARARPTLYTPYERMHGGMSERELSAFNRQTFVEFEEVGAGIHKPIDYLNVIFGGDDYVTTAPARIPQHAERGREAVS